MANIGQTKKEPITIIKKWQISAKQEKCFGRCWWLKTEKYRPPQFFFTDSDNSFIFLHFPQTEKITDNDNKNAEYSTNRHKLVADADR